MKKTILMCLCLLFSINALADYPVKITREGTSTAGDSVLIMYNTCPSNNLLCKSDFNYKLIPLSPNKVNIGNIEATIKPDETTLIRNVIVYQDHYEITRRDFIPGLDAPCNGNSGSFDLYINPGQITISCNMLL